MRRLPLLFLVLAACGDDSARKIADAPAGPKDSPPLIDTPPQALPVLVSVVFADGTPVPDVKIYFQNADSSVVGESPLDASGNARQVMNAGGYATAVVPNVLIGGFGGPSMQYTLATWAGVKPGDHLILTPPDNSGVSVQATVTVPLDTAHAGTIAQYSVESTCSGQTYMPPPSGSGATSLAIPVSFEAGCSAADMFVSTVDASYNPISSFSIPAQPVTANEMIDYTLQTYAVAGTRTYTLNNFTTGLAVDIADNLSTGRGQLHSGVGAAASTANPATLTAPYPVAPAGSLDVVFLNQQGSNTDRNFVEWGTTGPYTTDWAADLLPDFATAPTLDTGTHVVSWTNAGGTLTPDLSAAALLVFRSTVAWQWGIVGPGGTQLAFPNLPTDIADFNIQATDSFNVDGNGTVRMSKVPGGYDAARGTFFQYYTPVPTGATGTAAFNDYQPPLTVAAKQNGAKHGVMRRWIRPR
jgi:hypothetical protein